MDSAAGAPRLIGGLLSQLLVIMMIALGALITCSMVCANRLCLVKDAVGYIPKKWLYQSWATDSVAIYSDF